MGTGKLERIKSEEQGNKKTGELESRRREEETIFIAEFKQKMNIYIYELNS